MLPLMYWPVISHYTDGDGAYLRLSSKESCLQGRRCRFGPWARRSLEKKWQPISPSCPISSSNSVSYLPWHVNPIQVIPMDSEAERCSAILIVKILERKWEVTFQCQTGWDKRSAPFLTLRPLTKFILFHSCQSCWVDTRWMILKSW